MQDAEFSKKSLLDMKAGVAEDYRNLTKEVIQKEWGACMTNLDLGKMFGDSNQEMQKATALKTYLVKLDEILPSEEIHTK